jgi:hypothetical protein
LHRVYTMTSTYFIVQGVYNETPWFWRCLKKVGK